jgi:hypothetical protein
MQIGFKNVPCGRIKFKDCFEKCPMGERCFPLPVLKLMGRTREWTGRLSTTQALNGTREVLLNINIPYYIDPNDMVFATLGTASHTKVEKMSDKNDLFEEFLEDDITTGFADLLSDEGDKMVLWDYKTYGSWKTAKLLGIDKKKIPSPTGEVYKRKTTVQGKVYEAGDIKMVDDYFINPDKIDNWDVSMQLNRYRIFYEVMGFKVDKMKVYIMMKDGNQMSAKQRGLDKNHYVVDVPKLDDKEVLDYYKMKHEAMQDAIKTGEAPLCTDKERWWNEDYKSYGKCEKFCSLRNFCKIRCEIEGIEFQKKGNENEEKI